MNATFLMISRILYEKGYREYVEAAKIIHKKYPNIKFLLLGGIDKEYPGAVPGNIVQEDNDNSHIIYLGYRKDVRSIMANSDCIVLPSYYNEGLSRVLMEGLAMSKPLITTNMPGCRETVEDGINGYICQPRDIDSLVLCCVKFLSLTDEERAKMGKKGRKKAEIQFDINNVIKVYESITSHCR